ncbi:MAG: hypothetical protein ACSHXB_11105 [Sulfitobacter sp.]
MRPIILAALCAIVPIMASAQAFRAESWLIVVPLNAKDFEVIEDRGEGPRGMWCAAADFVKSRLGTSTNTRIYIKSGRGPSISAAGRKGVVFTTDPARLSAEPSRGYSVSLSKVGYSLPVGHAYSFCTDYWEILLHR